MPEDKNDAGFKVVDRRSFATETSPAPAAQEPPAAPPKIESSADSAPVAFGSESAPRIEIPGGDDALDLEGGPGQEPYSPFETLVSYLGTTAMFQLGLMAGPSGERIPADLRNARQTINMLEVLQEKTRGNLTPDENRLLEDILYELRMAYVEVEKRSRPK